MFVCHGHEHRFEFQVAILNLAGGNILHIQKRDAVLAGVVQCPPPNFHSPRPMPTKREREDDNPVVQSPDTLRALLSSSIPDRATAQIVLRHIMKVHDVDLNKLERLLRGPSMSLDLWKLTGFELPLKRVA